MTDDLGRELRERLGRAALPTAPSSLRDEIRRLRGMAAPTPARRRSARPPLILLAAAFVTLTALAAGVGGASLLQRNDQHRDLGLISSPSPSRQPRGLLAYGLNDDIYLADQDGAHPRKVADGAPFPNGAHGGPSYVFGDGGPAWAPDGRHFLFFDLQGPDGAAQLTGHIADANGHVVASIPNIWVDATWSPDSTRIEGWTGDSAWIGTTQIGIYGIDGALQESLPLPTGYVRARESPGFWAPDGRSVYVRLGQGGAPTGYWQLPVNGSAPRSLAQDELIARSGGDVSFSRDGSRMAGNVAGTLFVAKADGTDLRALGTAGSLRPIWSPTGTQVAYLRVIDADAQTADIGVVDIASGADRIVVTGLKINGPGLLGWSLTGERILFAGLDQQGSSLWSINADGTDRKLLVAGATGGAWRPVPIP